MGTFLLVVFRSYYLPLLSYWLASLHAREAGLSIPYTEQAAAGARIAVARLVALNVE